MGNSYPVTYLAVLFLLITPIIAEEDCLTGEWETWSSCLGTGIDLLQSQGVGKSTRDRNKTGGLHCEKRDLVETKLCAFSDQGSSSDSKGGDSDTDSDKGAGGGEGGGSTDDHGKDGTKHLAGDRTERTVFVTLLSVAGLLLTVGGVVGTVLIRQHRALQRRHKILVMTKERISLLDGKKLQVKNSGNMLCGMGPQCGTGPQFTLHNPIYESEGEEDMARASIYSTGQLKLQSK